MDKSKKNGGLIYLKIIFLCGILITSAFTGCIEEKQKPREQEISKVKMDQPSILPDWTEGEYHDYYETTDKLEDFNIKYPDLVDVFSIGRSVLGRDIWCIKITNEKNHQNKYIGVIDGCIHGTEWEAGEICLYLAEYLLINFGENKTISNIMNTSEIYFIPLLNPDGREEDIRWNANGIDLNRNFDVHFGRIRGHSFRLGKLFGFIKIPMITLPRKGVYTNCGRKPFSEPETASFRNFMESLNHDRLSFYVNCHTAMHCFASIMEIPYRPEFTVTEHEKNILNNVLYWVEENTEYEIFPVDEYNFYGAGFAHHWVFKEFKIPSFIFELLSHDYEPGFTPGRRHDSLTHWMKTTLPVFMYLFVNMENLCSWETPDASPVLPEGVPLAPLE